MVIPAIVLTPAIAVARPVAAILADLVAPAAVTLAAVIAVAPIALGLLIAAFRSVPKAERTIVERARDAGEPV